MTGTRTIHLPSGTVHATVTDGVLDARGVRYGSAPDRRGAPVAPPREVQAVPTAFPQVPGLLDVLLGPALAELPQSEDSFSVRVQAPSELPVPAALPVVVFIHGGGFTTGSGEVRWYDAADLVRSGQVVLVSVNHRLGALGLPGADGEIPAFGDLLAALTWVRENVSAFGGDPDDLTLMGDSAGAWWAHALSTSPRAAGLVRRTVLVSMPRMEPLRPEDDAHRRALLDEHLPADPGGEVPSATDDASLSALLAAQTAASRAYRGAGFGFAPARSPALAPWLGHPRESARHLHVERVLCLTTRDEASAFLGPRGPEAFTGADVEAALQAHFGDPVAARAALLPSARAEAGGPGAAYCDAVAVQTFWQFQSTVQELAAAATVPVHLVRLDVESPAPGMGSPHCFTLPFLFGDRDAWADAPMLAGLDPDTFSTTRAALQDLVLAFVRDRPTSAPAWDDEAPCLLAVAPEGVTLQPVPGKDLEVRP